MRAIDDDPQPIEPLVAGCEHMLDVLVQAFRVIPDPADEAPDGPCPWFAEPRGDGVLDVVGELVPPRARNLMPLSGIGL